MMVWRRPTMIAAGEGGATGLRRQKTVIVAQDEAALPEVAPPEAVT